MESHKTLWKPLPDWDPSLMYIEPPHAYEGYGVDDATNELHVGSLPPLLEVEEETLDAFEEASPISTIQMDLSAVPAFGLK